MKASTLEKQVEQDKAPFPEGTFHACEKCGHRSYYFADVNGTILSYCGHHANEYEIGLLAASQGRVWDFRHTISG